MSTSTTTEGAPLYASFSRRVRGMFIDWTIAIAVLFGAVAVGSWTGNNDASRAVGWLMVAFLLLYEPVLVTTTGGTVGHWANNVRVVDDKTGGNPGFLKALARHLVKSVLGWYSFLSLLVTRRNQAVHDLLTRSTVQIRDASKALPGQYRAEQPEPAYSGMPSRLRRSLVTVLYVGLSFALCAVIAAALMISGAYSTRCVEQDFCSAGERAMDVVISLCALLSILAVVALGWKGRLPGARRA